MRRPGIVHRLDKDTSGLLVAAKSDAAHRDLVAQFAARSIERRYAAFVWGLPVPAKGEIAGNIGRSPRNRKKMAVVKEGKKAVTHFQVARKFGHHSLLKLQLETGRTHQIRVHMAHLQYPLLGDPLYGGRGHVPAACDVALIEAIQGFQRQALHAERLSFVHPRSAETVSFEAPLAADFASLLDMLERYD